MAKEVLDQIRKAEEDAQEIVNSAQMTAREIIREANAKAEQILTDNVTAIKTETAALLAEAEAEAVAEFEARKDSLLKEIEEQKKSAEGQLKDVREYILGRIL